ncbi:hypothetical protein FACS1894132_03470 [Clostridia bacterium]|nr:hypothetical protein FACS1894132_03470 [Clostridia bacterium]
MIKFSKAEISENIRAHGEKLFPNECCGVLLGQVEEDGSRIVIDILPIENARENDEQYHRFVITPEDFMKAEHTAIKRGLDLVGIYHSHPNAPARPSQYDKDHALPFYSYVIVSVQDGKSVDFTSWELSEDRVDFSSEKIV